MCRRPPAISCVDVVLRHRLFDRRPSCCHCGTVLDARRFLSSARGPQRCSRCCGQGRYRAGSEPCSQDCMMRRCASSERHFVVFILQIVIESRSANSGSATRLCVSTGRHQAVTMQTVVYQLHGQDQSPGCTFLQGYEKNYAERYRRTVQNPMPGALALLLPGTMSIVRMASAARPRGSQ